MDTIKKLRTSIDDVIFVNPPGRHSGSVGSFADKEIFKIIDNSKDFDDFIQKLDFWSENRLPNGKLDLPEGLKRK